MGSDAVGCDGRAKENMKVPVESDSDAWLPSSDKKHVTWLFFNDFPDFSIIIDLIGRTCDFSYECSTRVQITVESKHLTLAQMPVSTEIQTCTDSIYVCRSMIDIRITHADKQ